MNQQTRVVLFSAACVVFARVAATQNDAEPRAESANTNAETVAPKPAPAKPAPAETPAKIPAERLAAHRARVEREVQRLVRLLASRSKTTSTKARDDLLDLAYHERIKGLGYAVEKKHYELRKAWAERIRAERRVVVEDGPTIGLLDVRAQKVDLLGFDTFTTSLGTGTPVTIQLPRTRSISIGTTVAVPMR